LSWVELSCVELSWVEDRTRVAMPPCALTIRPTPRRFVEVEDPLKFGYCFTPTDTEAY
jgi:hypothetical protein